MHAGGDDRSPLAGLSGLHVTFSEPYRDSYISNHYEINLDDIDNAIHYSDQYVKFYRDH